MQFDQGQVELSGLYFELNNRVTCLCISYLNQKVHSGGSRIFPRWARQLPKNYYFPIFFAENCIKMKEFGPPGGRASLAPPLDSPIVYVYHRIGKN